jgi:hypothetical protein
MASSYLTTRRRAVAPGLAVRSFPLRSNYSHSVKTFRGPARLRWPGCRSVIHSTTAGTTHSLMTPRLQSAVLTLPDQRVERLLAHKRLVGTGPSECQYRRGCAPHFRVKLPTFRMEIETSLETRERDSRLWLLSRLGPAFSLSRTEAIESRAWAHKVC